MTCERIEFGACCRRCRRKTLNRGGLCAVCLEPRGKGATRRPRRDKWRRLAEEFRRLYLAGVRMADIAARLDVSKRRLRRWREALGLPARPPGRPRKQAVA